jgi:monooxygenase
MAVEHFDVLIVGAGLSGIGAAVHLQRDCPQRRFAMLEGRAALGGTWDLFRYPGVRSDSDMYTLGYAHKPWTDAKAIADGPAILRYLQSAARDAGLERHIRYGHSVKNAAWSSTEALWTVDALVNGVNQQFTCNFLLMCSGYYNYTQGYTPDFAGLPNFQGRVIHPQQWPVNFDCTDQRVVVIGSGATAVTLVPALATSAAHVTMLQRSPTYVVARPSEDRLSKWFNRCLPQRLAYTLSRWKNLLMAMLVYKLCKWKPELVKKALLKEVKKALGADFDVAKHFTPSYKPWDQRVCLVPDGDFFKSIKSGKASVATDHIVHFTETGIALQSGQVLEADIVVTATGLDLLMLGGVSLTVDGAPVDIPSTTNYRGMMLSDVPNMAYVFGYTNASWTLRADLTSEYLCRLLGTMAAKGHKQCTPRLRDAAMHKEAFVDFSSGYFQRALHTMPKQGSKKPWRQHQNYFSDIASLRWAKLDDGAMEFKP